MQDFYSHINKLGRGPCSRKLTGREPCSRGITGREPCSRKLTGREPCSRGHEKFNHLQLCIVFRNLFISIYSFVVDVDVV